jgi:hypothetical protein
MLEDETKKINLKSLSKQKKKRIKYDRKKIEEWNKKKIQS